MTRTAPTANVPPLHPVLVELLRTGVTPTPDGGSVRLESHVLADEAEFLAGLVREHSPVTALEVGLAMGCSAIAIGDAMREVPGARHILIDPRQLARPLWAGIGLYNLERAGL